MLCTYIILITADPAGDWNTFFL